MLFNTLELDKAVKKRLRFDKIRLIFKTTNSLIVRKCYFKNSVESFSSKETVTNYFELHELICIPIF